MSKIFSVIYKKTFKNIVTSPITLLSLIAVFFIWLNTKGGAHPIDGNSSYRSFAELIYNFVNVPLATMLPTFTAIMCGIDILRDHKNLFYDIQKASLMKIRTYYAAKMTAYISICYILFFIYVVSQSVYFFSVGDGKTAMQTFSVQDYIVKITRQFLVLSVPYILTYISLTVFITLLSKNSIVGIISAVIYSLFGFLFRSASSFFEQYIYVIPEKIFAYMYAYGTDYSAEFGGTLSGVIISYSLIILLSAALLAGGYLMLSKRDIQ